MSGFQKSDLWFGAVTLIFFSVLAVLFFGRTVTSAEFWLNGPLIVGFTILWSMSYKFLARFGLVANSVGAFLTGTVFVVCIQLILAGGSVDFISAMITGAVMALFTFISRRNEPSETSAD